MVVVVGAVVVVVVGAIVVVVVNVLVVGVGCVVVESTADVQAAENPSTATKTARCHVVIRPNLLRLGVCHRCSRVPHRVVKFQAMRRVTDMVRSTHGGSKGSSHRLNPDVQGELVNLSKWAQWARVRFFDARGASMVEYALLIGLIALVVIAGAILLGDSLVTKFDEFGSTVQSTP